MDATTRTPEMLRPAAAARRFGISERTLARWADEGLIGRSQVGRNVWYVAEDVAELIAANLKRRTVVPLAASASEPNPRADDWRADPFWSGGSR